MCARSRQWLDRKPVPVAHTAAEETSGRFAPDGKRRSLVPTRPAVEKSSSRRSWPGGLVAGIDRRRDGTVLAARRQGVVLHRG